MKNTKLTTLALLVVGTLSVVNFNTGWAKHTEDKVKEFIDDVSDSFKKGVEKLGDDFKAIQHYLDHYHWKGLIQDKATSGAVTLKHLKLNDNSRVIVVKPGERIEGTVRCDLDKEQCSPLSLYRVVLGLKGEGAQTTVGKEFGVVAGKSDEEFVLIAPAKPGFYQLRFRLVESLLESTALNAWVDEAGNEPDGTTTIGGIFVKS